MAGACQWRILTLVPGPSSLDKPGISCNSLARSTEANDILLRFAEYVPVTDFVRFLSVCSAETQSPGELGRLLARMFSFYRRGFHEDVDLQRHVVYGNS
jgi:hypothetical protein